MGLNDIGVFTRANRTVPRFGCVLVLRSSYVENRKDFEIFSRPLPTFHSAKGCERSNEQQRCHGFVG